jgi:single-stranded-DNA-specific exonuclease
MSAHITMAQRPVPPRARATLEQAGVPPLLARLFAARGVTSKEDVSDKLNGLLPPASLTHAERAATLLADAIGAREKICIVADYDCDGATACAVAMRGLSMMGAVVDFIVPNRFETGYGLSPEVVALVAQHPRMGKPDWIITVDNGIASVDGVAAANALGMRVLVTDHHLPAAQLPAAACIVNPNQPGCDFASKNLAGVGVMFYVLLALRAELRKRGVYTQQTQPRLDALLDLVALGTVADVVTLDTNNRKLVAQGLARMRAGQMQPGIAALFSVAARDARQASTFDLGFGVGPRINAAGRLADMSLGIACLLANDQASALPLAQQLDAINRERREIESGMQFDALESLENTAAEKSAIVLFDPSWHQGVVGIVAGRIKDKFWRPTIAFAPASDDGAGELRGSGRSIPGLHLRDALDLVTKREPRLIKKFGGHAMAAGLTLPAEHLAAFTTAFERVCEELLEPTAKMREVLNDGALGTDDMSAQTVQTLQSQVWGQGFGPPLFCNRFEVVSQRILKDKHLKLALRLASGNDPSTKPMDGIWFGHTETLPPIATLVYRLSLDSYQGVERVQIMVDYSADAASA